MERQFKLKFMNIVYCVGILGALSQVSLGMTSGRDRAFSDDVSSSEVFGHKPMHVVDLAFNQEALNQEAFNPGDYWLSKGRDERTSVSVKNKGLVVHENKSGSKKLKTGELEISLRILSGRSDKFNEEEVIETGTTKNLGYPAAAASLRQSALGLSSRNLATGDLVESDVLNMESLIEDESIELFFMKVENNKKQIQAEE